LTKRLEIAGPKGSIQAEDPVKNGYSLFYLPDQRYIDDFFAHSAGDLSGAQVWFEMASLVDWRCDIRPITGWTHPI
jgi:hypothetical protein